MSDENKIIVSVDGAKILGDLREWRARLALLIEKDGRALLYTDSEHDSEQSGMRRRDVFYGLAQHYQTSTGAAIADPAAIRALARELQPLVDRVVAGRGSRWVYEGPVGTMTDDASSAWDAIRARFNDMSVNEWAKDVEIFRAEDALTDVSVDESGRIRGLIEGEAIAPQDAGARISEIVEHIEDEAAGYGQALIDVRDAVEAIIEEAEAEAEAE